MCLCSFSDETSCTTPKTTCVVSCGLWMSEKERRCLSAGMISLCNIYIFVYVVVIIPTSFVPRDWPNLVCDSFFFKGSYILILVCLGASWKVSLEGYVYEVILAVDENCKTSSLRLRVVERMITIKVSEAIECILCKMAVWTLQLF